MGNGDTLAWTREMLNRFIPAYARAVAEGFDTFPFEGHTFLVSYAEYLIEFLDGALAHDPTSRDKGTP